MACCGEGEFKGTELDPRVQDRESLKGFERGTGEHHRARISSLSE
jgi:hypothetical protein